MMNDMFFDNIDLSTTFEKSSKENSKQLQKAQLRNSFNLKDKVILRGFNVIDKICDDASLSTKVKYRAKEHFRDYEEKKQNKKCVNSIVIFKFN